MTKTFRCTITFSSGHHLGLVQLEALESLSAECNASVQTRLSTMPRLSLEDIKPQLVAIKKAFQVLDIDSDDGTLGRAISRLIARSMTIVCT